MIEACAFELSAHYDETAHRTVADAGARWRASTDGIEIADGPYERDSALRVLTASGRLRAGHLDDALPELLALVREISPTWHVQAPLSRFGSRFQLNAEADAVSARRHGIHMAHLELAGPLSTNEERGALSSETTVLELTLGVTSSGAARAVLGRLWPTRVSTILTEQRLGPSQFSVVASVRRLVTPPGERWADALDVLGAVATRWATTGGEVALTATRPTIRPPGIIACRTLPPTR